MLNVIEHVKSLNPICQTVLNFDCKQYATKIINESETYLSEETKKDIYDLFGLDQYKFTYVKNKNGWYMFCEKNNNYIKWDDIENWLRPVIWDYEKENKNFQ